MSLADELQAASDARLAGWRAEREEPDQIRATPERLRHVLIEGGRAVVTVRSRATGSHVTVRLTAKKREGGRFLSRAQNKGRVGLEEADAVFLDDEDREWPDSELGRFDLGTGELKFRETADEPRRWAADWLLRHALWPVEDWYGGLAVDRAEVYLAAECCCCGRRLTDPVSIERGVGPECYGKRTKSRAAEREDEE